MPHTITASVIVLGYNGKDFLAECLASILDQSYPAEDYEVIYADNASIDGSADLVAERFPSVRMVRFERNLGFAEGNNRAAELARGRYLVFLNQDTVVHRHWLTEMVAAMGNDPLVARSIWLVRSGRNGLTGVTSARCLGLGPWTRWKSGSRTGRSPHSTPPEWP
jgi:GT2 family glycosyltransferase